MLRTISDGPHGGQPIETTGAPLGAATGAVILLHGRGATSAAVLDLSRVLPHPDAIYLAPQAAEYAWYPDRFIAPIERNEPHLSSALETVGRLIERIAGAGIQRDRIVLGGFSQGACLAVEYAARHPERYGGLLVFSGGLIGPPGGLPEYAGSLGETPAFLGCSDVDPHIPLERVHETEAVLKAMNANVSLTIYPGMGHTIIADEIRQAQALLVRAFG